MVPPETRAAVCILGLRSREGAASCQRTAIFGWSGPGSKELYPCSRPRTVEGAGVNFVEVDTPCSVGSQRVRQHRVAPFLSAPSSPHPRLRLSQLPANPSIVRRLMPLTRWFWPYILGFGRAHTSVAPLILWFSPASHRDGTPPSPYGRPSRSSRRLVKGAPSCDSETAANRLKPPNAASPAGRCDAPERGRGRRAPRAGCR